MHTFATGTNPRKGSEARAWNLLYSHHWDVSVWDPPQSLVPYNYNEWHDLHGRVYWWLLTDFNSMPGVTTYSSIPELFQILESDDSLLNLSASLRLHHLQRVSEA